MTQHYIGQEKVKVFQMLRDENRSFRLVREDDRHFIVTQDIVFTRFNLEVENNIVVNIYNG